MSVKHSRQLRSRALTDHFLHQDFYADADVLHRARVLVSALYAFTGITLAAIPALFLLPIASTMLLLAILSCIAVAAAFVYLLFTLRLHGRYMLSATVAASIPSLAIMSSISLTGGIFESPSSQLLVLQPLVAFFITGVRGGVLATLGIAIVIASFVVLQRFGVEFPQIIPVEYIGIMWAAILLLGFFVIGVMALAYEFTSTSLRRERDAEHARVVRLANTDSLTGLANRRAFDSALSAHISAAQASTDVQEFSLCYLDLDGFKPINDQHGHDVGDQVLRAVSIRLRSALRGADLIGRQGGDEFMLLLGGLGANRALEVMAQRFIDMVRQPIETSAGLVSVGASLGFAVYPLHATSAEALKKAADIAMYTAKRNRSGWLLFAPHMSEHSDKDEPGK